MGRTVVFEEKVNYYLSKHAKEKGQHVGLILGCSTSERDVVIHLARTPSKDEEKNNEEENNEEENILDDPKAAKKAKKSKKPVEKVELDESWICQHAKQVTRMLPGGFDVLGLFIYGPPDYCNQHLPTLRQVLFAIYKQLNKDQELGFCNNVKDRIQLHICSVTSKVICRTFDVGDYKSSAKPADWKALSSPIQWSQIDTNFDLDYWLPVSEDKSKLSLIKQIQISFASLYNSVAAGLVLIDGSMKEPNQILNPSKDDHKKSKQKDKKNTSLLPKLLEHKADLFLPMINRNVDEEPKSIMCGAAMDLKGTFHSRALVPSKSTIEEAVQALKQDIIRSLTARYEIHCEDMLQINEENQDPNLVHELPKRVFAKLPNNVISVSDYVYHGDSAIDSLDAFYELLNLEFKEEDIDTSQETSAANQELESDIEERLSEAGEQVMEVLNNQRNVILPAVTVALVSTAVGLGFYFLQSN